MHSKQGTGIRKAMITNDSTSVIVVVGKEEEHLVVGDIPLLQGRSEITLDRVHRITSVKRHHLE